MRFPKEMKPEACASLDETRQCITEPYLEGDKLISTDGNCMVVITVRSDPGDVNGYVPRAVLDAARKDAKRLKLGDLRVEAGSASLRVGDPQMTFPRPALGAFPLCHEERAGLPARNDPGTVTVGIDARLIARLAKAAGDPRFILTIKIPQDAGPATCVRDAIRVVCPGTPKFLGVLMPMGV